MAVRAGGEGGLCPESSQHRHDLRHRQRSVRRGRGRGLHRDGVRRGNDARPRRRAAPPPDRGGPRLRRPDRRRARRGAHGRDRPSRHQAGEHHRRLLGTGEGPGLRAGEIDGRSRIRDGVIHRLARGDDHGSHGRPGNPRGSRPRNALLHVAGAGAGQGRGRALRRVLPGLGSLRVALGKAPLPGRLEPDDARDDPARSRSAAHERPAGRAGGPRARRRARAREEPRGPVSLGRGNARRPRGLPGAPCRTQRRHALRPAPGSRRGARSRRSPPLSAPRRGTSSASPGFAAPARSLCRRLRA